jgi:hypothetical protein
MLPIVKDTFPPGTSIINRFTPVQIVPVARVTINGGNPQFVMMNPFSIPIIKPQTTGTTIQRTILAGVSTKGKLAAITFENPIIAPIDRSIPPVNSTNIWAIPARRSGVIRENRLTLFAQVKNRGCMMVATK